MTINFNGQLTKNSWCVEPEFQIPCEEPRGTCFYYPDRRAIKLVNWYPDGREIKRPALPEEIAKFSAMILAGEYEIDDVPF